MLFAGPPEDDIDWADMSPGTHAKFLAQVRRVVRDGAALPDGQLNEPARPDRGSKTVDDSTRLSEVLPLQRRDQPAA